MRCTVETLIRAAALTHFSLNFGHVLLSKMRLLIKLRLLLSFLWYDKSCYYHFLGSIEENPKYYILFICMVCIQLLTL